MAVCQGPGPPPRPVLVGPGSTRRRPLPNDANRQSAPALKETGMSTALAPDDFTLLATHKESLGIPRACQE